MPEKSISEKDAAGSNQTEPEPVWEMTTSGTLENRQLLQETLRYLRREDSTAPGIGASRRSGELEGPEQRRFLLAEKIEAFLAKPDPVVEMLREIKAELKTAGDFGKFDEHEYIEDAPYPEIVAVNIMKAVAKKYGVEI